MRALAKWSTDLRRQAVVLAFLGLAAVPHRAAAQNALFAPTGSLTYGRLTHTATVLPDGKVLIAGGSTAVASAELYDAATGTFTMTGSMAEARIQHTATLLPSGKVLITGGQANIEGMQRSTASAELYDPAAGTFTATGGMGWARHLHTATLLTNGKVLIAGGYSWDSPLASAELYDPEAGTFTSTGGTLSTGRADHAAVLLPNGKVLVVGGQVLTNGAYTITGTAELYDPNNRRGGTFTPTGHLVAVRMRLTATRLPTGRVLIAGGTGANPTPTFAELYDPAAGTFTATGSMREARDGPAATLLPNGKVLVAGGRVYRDYGSGPDATAELYDPATGTFTATANNMSSSRAFFTLTPLPTNGKVLAAAGYPWVDGGGATSADLYGDLQPCF